MMNRWDFDLIVEGRDLTEDEALDAIWHASEVSGDDIHPGWCQGVQHAGFMREANCLEEAVLTAVEQVESIGGVTVVGLRDESFVTMAEIARRGTRTVEEVRELVTATQGPGNFPLELQPSDNDCALWRWASVDEWFQRELGERLADPNAEVFAALSSALETRQRCNALPKDHRKLVGRLIAADVK